VYGGLAFVSDALRVMESSESASPTITRLVGAWIRGEPEQAFPLSLFERSGLRILEGLPLPLIRRLAAWRVTRAAHTLERLHTLQTDDLVSRRLLDYAGIERQFQAVIVGSALGGAAAHLAALLGAPFLPQPFILGAAGGTPDDELSSYLGQVVPLAEGILKRNEELAAVAHFDPIHDGWLTPYLAHLRLKLIRLPAAYRLFISKHLKPGGTIVYLDCRARWLQYELGDRLSLQVGGWGGIPAQEFISGSERIDRFLAERGSAHRGGWRLEGQHPVQAFESEWGSVNGLDKELEAFAQDAGFRFEALRFVHPHDYSTLAYQAHLQQLMQHGVEPKGVLIEMFTQYAPGTVLRHDLLPLWLVFNTQDSRAYLEQARTWFPTGVPVYLSALVTLSRTPDMVPFRAWAQALDGLDWLSVGARPDRYPEDLRALVGWLSTLEQALPPPRKNTPTPMKVEGLVELAGRIETIDQLIP
jgi:hypothetical protein